MKKPSSLGQQIQQAQRLLASWPDSRKSSLRLEGSDIFLNKRPQQTTPRNPAQAKNK
ncbi:hypothetical protein PQQ99_22645 [Paraburkholderia sediminicola]|uniref:hypothetical protein n=1 Tax=Paraburkholderia sediminicola TaxID=458836 RepID=UPI0038B84004